MFCHSIGVVSHLSVLLCFRIYGCFFFTCDRRLGPHRVCGLQDVRKPRRLMWCIALEAQWSYCSFYSVCCFWGVQRLRVCRGVTVENSHAYRTCRAKECIDPTMIQLFSYQQTITAKSLDPTPLWNSKTLFSALKPTMCKCMFPCGWAAWWINSYDGRLSIVYDSKSTCISAVQSKSVDDI